MDKNFKLPIWKKIPHLEYRGVRKEIIDSNFSSLVLEATDKEVKETLLKYKTNLSYDSNVKNLLSADVKPLVKTAKYLGQEVDGLIKNGIAYSIMSGIFRLMPYLCNNCNTSVSHSDDNDFKCQSCGTTTCYTCSNTNNNICTPCIKQLKEKYTTPQEYFRKNFRKVDLRDTTTADVTVRNLTDITKNGADDESLPLGQGDPPSQSTLIGDQLLDESGFSLSQSRRTKRKERKKEKKDEKKIPEKSGDCRFFLRGACKHGFTGKKVIDGQTCGWNHPKTCRKFLANGTGKGGCNLGENCDYIHPKICPHSLKERTCPNLNSGSKCFKGFHRRGTKPEEKVDDKPKMDKENKDKKKKKTKSKPKKRSDEGDGDDDEDLDTSGLNSSDMDDIKSFLVLVKGKKKKKESKGLRILQALMSL